MLHKYIYWVIYWAIYWVIGLTEYGIALNKLVQLNLYWFWLLP